MSETANSSKIVAFPVSELHRLDAGGASPPMEIKHTHPSHASDDKRAENLKEKHRECLTLIAAARSKQALREGKGA